MKSPRAPQGHTYLSFTACREVLKRLTWVCRPGVDRCLGHQPVPAAGSECQGDTSGRPDGSDVGLSHGYVEGHENPQPCGFSLSPFTVFLVLLRAEGTRSQSLGALGFPRARVPLLLAWRWVFLRVGFPLPPVVSSSPCVLHALSVCPGFVLLCLLPLNSPRISRPVRLYT